MSEPGPDPNRPALLTYGALALPLAFAGLPVYLHAPDFYATSYGLTLAALGGVLLALRAVDAVQDPLIGVLSDRFAHRRRAILLAGGFLLMAGFAGLFNPPAVMGEMGGGALIWFALNVFICTTGFSIVTINYQALGGLWRVSRTGRTRITATREAFGLVGILAASILPSVLSNRYDAAVAFQIVSLVLAVLLLVGGFLFARWHRRAQIADAVHSAGGPTGAAKLRGILRSDWGKRFYGIFFISNFASAIPAVLVLFYIRDRLAAAEWTGAFLLVYFLSGATSMPVWQIAARRTGKAKAWAVSMIVAVATFVWAFTLGPGDIVPFAIVCALSGAALGADLALPPAMVADRIADTGHQDRAASYFAASAFFAKASFALATGVSLPVLDALGYVPGIQATAGAAFGLSAVYALAPCAIKIVSVVWLLRTQAVFVEDNPP